TIWFRNVWSWGNGELPRPMLRQSGGAIELEHHALGRRRLECEGEPELLFTENDTNLQRLFGAPNTGPYVQDGINDYIVYGARGAVNPEQFGTKAAARYVLPIGAGETRTVRLRLSRPGLARVDFDQTFADRIQEAGEFYATIIPTDLAPDAKNVMRQ